MSVRSGGPRDPMDSLLFGCWLQVYVTPISSSSSDIMVFLVFPDTNLSEKLSKRITQTCWAVELSARSTWPAANASGAKEDWGGTARNEPFLESCGTPALFGNS